MRGRHEPRLLDASADAARDLAQAPELGSPGLALEVLLADGKLLGTLDFAFPALPGSELFEAWLGRSQVEPLPAGFALLGVGLERFMSSLDDTLVITPRAREEMIAALRGVLPDDARSSLAVGRDRAAAARVLDSEELMAWRGLVP